MKFGIDWQSHGGEARHLKLEIPGTPYGKDMNFFNILINNCLICMGFEADREEKVQKLAYLIRFSEKCLIKKLLTSKC